MRGRDIKRNGYEWAGLYVILTVFGSHKYIPEKYPAIYAHLLPYKPKLEKRGQCRYLSSGKVRQPGDKNYPGFPGMHHWLELDNNPRQEYMDDFSKQKIVYPETTQSARFFYDNNGFMVEKTCFIMVGEHLEYIASTLSSSLFEFAYKRLFSSVELGSNGYQYNKHALEKLPIAPITNSTKISDEKINSLYNLTDDEINFISSSVKPNNIL